MYKCIYVHGQYVCLCVWIYIQVFMFLCMNLYAFVYVYNTNVCFVSFFCKVIDFYCSEFGLTSVSHAFVRSPPLLCHIKVYLLMLAVLYFMYSAPSHMHFLYYNTGVKIKNVKSNQNLQLSLLHQSFPIPFNRLSFKA